MGRTLAALVTLALGTVLFLGVACGGGGDEDEAAVEAAALAVVEAYNSGDVEAFLAAVSDDLPANIFGFFGITTKEDFRQAADDPTFLGDPPIEDFEVSNISVSGDSATADTSEREGRAVVNERASLIKVGESWLLDDVEPRRVPAPEGATEVDMGLVEFAFNLTQLSFPAGDVAFQAHNDGEQYHEMFIAKLPEGVSLQEALEAEDPEALGIEDIAFFFPIDPGAEATWIVEGLEPGRYGYVCFVPDAADPEGAPHAAKGMVGEFAVE